MARLAACGFALLFPLLVGCQHIAHVDEQGNVTPVLELAEHDGYRGVWLSSDAIECFVAVEPTFRVLAIRRPGEPSMLASPGSPQRGVRLNVMNPGESSTSGKTAEVPGTIMRRTDHSASVQLTAEEVRYNVDIHADVEKPTITLRYRLTNLADEPRDLAVWSLTSFDKAGRIVVPLDEGGKALRRFTVPRWSPVAQPAMRPGRTALMFDMAHDSPEAPYKFGLATDAGWLAMVRGREALLSFAARQPNAAYPEGDANVTVFYFDRPAETWCEIEQVGPRVRLDAQQATSLTETIRLIALPEPSADPDAARRAIEAAVDFPPPTSRNP